MSLFCGNFLNLKFSKKYILIWEAGDVCKRHISLKSPAVRSESQTVVPSNPITWIELQEIIGGESWNIENLTHFSPFLHHERLQRHGEGTGLSALLPQPKNLSVKETNRLLLPHAFSRKAGENASDSKPAKAPTSSKSKPPAKPPVPTTPSPSAIKAAAKSAALQVTKQITQEEDYSDEDVEPENYFSLSDRSEPGLAPAEPFLYPGTEEPPPGTEPEPQFQDAAANAPLEFKTDAGSSGAQHGWLPKPGEDYGTQYGQFAAYGEAGAYYQVGWQTRGGEALKNRL